MVSCDGCEWIRDVDMAMLAFGVHEYSEWDVGSSVSRRSVMDSTRILLVRMFHDWNAGRLECSIGS